MMEREKVKHRHHHRRARQDSLVLVVVYASYLSMLVVKKIPS